MISAIRTTVPPASEVPDAIALITSPASTGVHTAMADDATTSTRKKAIRRRYGFAKRSTRSAVSRPTLRPPSSSRRRIERIMLQLLTAIGPIGWPTPHLPRRAVAVTSRR